MIKDLIRKIKRQAKLRKIKPSTLCRLAVNDGKLIKRLEAGKGIEIKTLDRLNKYFETPIYRDVKK